MRQGHSIAQGPLSIRNLQYMRLLSWLRGIDPSIVQVYAVNEMAQSAIRTEL